MSIWTFTSAKPGHRDHELLHRLQTSNHCLTVLLRIFIFILDCLFCDDNERRMELNIRQRTKDPPFLVLNSTSNNPFGNDDGGVYDHSASAASWPRASASAATTA
jgi:hypothetical protein